MSVIKTESLMKIYKQGQDEVRAVDNVSLSIEKGEFAAIIGQSGSGKTTLLNLLGGIETPTSGCVHIDGVNLQKAEEPQLAQLKRQKIGYIFQDFNLIPILSAQENIAMPMLLDGKRAKQEEIERLASFLGIDNRLKHFPSELSGGQKQRVAMARALDKHSADEIMELLLEIHRQGHTVLLVTHEQRYADMCPRKITLSDGRIVSDIRR